MYDNLTTNPPLDKGGGGGGGGRLLRGFAPEAGKGVNVYISYLWDQ